MASTHAPIDCDVLVLGGGIAGASAAAEIARAARVVLLESESQPGYHTTGRSAAFFAESYGGAAIRPLTAASKRFFLEPPAGFGETPLATARGALHIFSPDETARAEDAAATLAGQISEVKLLEAAEVLARVPVLRGECLGGGIDDPECRDLDVAAIHQGYLRRLRRRGGDVLCDAEVTALERRGGRWLATTRRGQFTAARVVNAAGAWADRVAEMAGLGTVGLTPMRRTVIVFRPESVAVDDAWPLVLDFDEDFYFKPETGRILASPADETPSAPCDAQPEELDVAITIDRLERATTLDMPRIDRKWAGLRSFAPDRVPVLGPDPVEPSFIWCAGQGGYGIQTAPAAARLTAACALDEALPDDLAACGVDAGTYDPARLALRSAKKAG